MGILPGLTIGVLGELEVSVNGGPIRLTTGRLRTMLVVLAMSAGKTVSAERLAGAVWEAEFPRNPRRSLQTYAGRLRAEIGERYLSSQPGGFVLNTDADNVDALRFVRIVDQAGRDHDSDRERELLGEAFRLWRGEPFEGVRSRWLEETEKPRLIERRLAALERRIDLDLAGGRHGALVAELNEWAVRYPKRESLWLRLMVALDRCGRQAEALERYAEVRARIAGELGVDPGPELQRVHADLLAGRPVAAPHQVATTRQRPVDAAARTESTWATHWQLPLDITAFTAREDTVERVRGLLTAGDGVPVVTVSGPPGVGKTALATRVGHSLRSSFPDGQWHLRLGGASVDPRDPNGLLAELLRASGLADTAIPDGLDERSAVLRSRLTDRRVLLLLDDARDTAQVAPLLPGAPGNAVLITSRNELTSLAALHGGHAVPLGVLTPGEAAELLVSVIGARARDAGPDVLVQLARICGQLPLALRIAAANLAVRPDRTVADYTAELRDGNLLAHLTIAGEPHTAVRAAFELSYSGLPEFERRAFRLLGDHPGSDFAADTAAALLDTTRDTAAALLEALASANLLQRHSTNRYHFHDLLRLYAAEKVASDDERMPAWTRLCDYYLRTAVAATRFDFTSPVHLPRPAPDEKLFGDSDSARTWLGDERSNLVAAVVRAADHGPPEAAWHLTDALRVYFCAIGHAVDLRRMAGAGLLTAQRSGDGLAEAMMEFTYGSVFGLLARERSALHHQQRALAGFERVGYAFGAAATGLNIGVGYARLDEYLRSVELLQRSRELFLQLERNEVLAIVGLNLCFNLAQLGRVREALEYADEGISFCRKSAPGFRLAFLLNNRSYPRQILGDSAGARADLDEALALSSELDLGYGVASTYTALSRLEAYEGNIDTGLAYARQGLDTAQRLHDLEQQMHARNALGMLYWLGGEPQTAIEQHLLVAEISDQHVKAHAESYVGLAAARGLEGDRAAALEDARRALELAQEAGLRIVECDALLEIASLSQELGRAADAATYAGRAQHIQEATGYRPPRWRSRGSEHLTVVSPEA